MLELIKDLLLHELCLEERFLVFLRDYLDCNNLFGFLVTCLHNNSKGTDTKDTNDLI